MFGNFIVLNAFVRNEKLRTINNLYIMNLSAADFCIGLGTVFRIFVIHQVDYIFIKILMKKPLKVSMNFFTVYLLYGEWKFGNYICDEMD